MTIVPTIAGMVYTYASLTTAGSDEFIEALTIITKHVCWNRCDAQADPIITIMLQAPWAMLRSCVWRRVNPNFWMMRLENTPRPPMTKFATRISITQHQTSGSWTASSTWYFLYFLFSMPVSLCRTRSIIKRFSSSEKHFAEMGLSGRNIPMMRDQRHVKRPSTRKRSCQFFIGPLVKWETPNPRRPPTWSC